MLIYLDQATSTKRHPNENLGRELLECHTVGRGSYTEDHVKASARILTGYTVDMWETWQALYNPEEHWRGHGQGDGLPATATRRRTAATSPAATSSTSRTTRRPPAGSPRSWP